MASRPNNHQLENNRKTHIWDWLSSHHHMQPWIHPWGESNENTSGLWITSRFPALRERSSARVAPLSSKYSPTSLIFTVLYKVNKWLKENKPDLWINELGSWGRLYLIWLSGSGECTWLPSGCVCKDQGNWCWEYYSRTTRCSKRWDDNGILSGWKSLKKC